MKPDEPIPLNLLRKTIVSLGLLRPKNHPISGHPINYGQVPFGCKDVNGTLQEDPLKQFVLTQIRKMRDDGIILNKIADYLIKSGVPAKNGGSNTVNKILGRAI